MSHGHWVSTGLQNRVCGVRLLGGAPIQEMFMFEYKIENGKVIFNKQGVYFSVPIKYLSEFKDLVARAQKEGSVTS